MRWWVLAVCRQRAFFPRSFLPPFNEGTLTVNVLLSPGTSLEESNRIGTLAEQLALQVPEVTQVGRRTGRAELDEHAEGCTTPRWISTSRCPSAAAGRGAGHSAPDWPPLPQPPAWGNPFRTAWTTCCRRAGADRALKVYGDDLDTLRGLAGDLRDRLSSIPGITDLQIEKQVLIPQIKIHLDYEQAGARYGVAPGAVCGPCSR